MLRLLRLTVNKVVFIAGTIANTANAVIASEAKESAPWKGLAAGEIASLRPQ